MTSRSFWDTYEDSERAVAVALELKVLEAKRQKAALRGPSQNAPTECSLCEHVGEDVLLGICEACA